MEECNIFLKHLVLFVTKLTCFSSCKKALLPKICYSYPAMMKLSTVIPYLKMIQRKKKMNESLKIVLINMITILMISAKMATLSLLKIKMF